MQRELDMAANQLLVAVDGGQVELGCFALSQSVLDHAPIAMMITSANDELIWANVKMEEILETSSAGLADRRSFLSFVHAEDQNGLATDTSELLTKEIVPDIREFRWLDLKGGTHWASVQTSIAMAESGEPLLYGEPARPCLIRQIIDITERKTTEQELARALEEIQERNVELERSNEELTQFAYVASHDLSEPLRVIAGHVELLSRRYAGQLDDDADRYIAFAVDGCTRMRILIEDLLSYSRAGREITLEVVDFDDVVMQVRRNLGPALEGAGGSFVVDGELPTFRADRRQLIQVFTNLVANSLKYAQEGLAPEVHMSARHEGRFWRIEIADNGIGVPEQHRERIFRIFQRLHGRDIPGTGIGLAICRKIVERQQGSIEVADSAYGGATFAVILPD
jgi:PAS domain S-box-containing protein